MHIKFNRPTELHSDESRINDGHTVVWIWQSVALGIRNVTSFARLAPAYSLGSSLSNDESSICPIYSTLGSVGSLSWPAVHRFLSHLFAKCKAYIMSSTLTFQIFTVSSIGRWSSFGNQDREGLSESTLPENLLLKKYRFSFTDSIFQSSKHRCYDIISRNSLSSKTNPLLCISSHNFSNVQG